ncbi:hypothetical protein CA13_63680 [Planctomycetes bacterium CA13]|uniref:Uncharacterized protein n=1 Tax=Novipirellula herctigrandis TaxID=2527986 RepID=A0A5C5ZCV1_9BACT|nr:hypothetical protein CA13_63680 [Planctomycetes bacterium CA13]
MIAQDGPAQNAAISGRPFDGVVVQPSIYQDILKFGGPCSVAG